jgi:hypothetical protein
VGSFFIPFIPGIHRQPGWEDPYGLDAAFPRRVPEQKKDEKVFGINNKIMYIE